MTKHVAPACIKINTKLTTATSLLKATQRKGCHARVGKLPNAHKNQVKQLRLCSLLKVSSVVLEDLAILISAT